jgi:hypothetical protein
MKNGQSNGEILEKHPVLSKKLVESIIQCLNETNSCRFAIINPIDLSIYAVISKDGKIYKPTEYSVPELTDGDKYMWSTKDFRWGKGWNKPIITDTIIREYQSNCPPLSRHNGECISEECINHF